MEFPRPISNGMKKGMVTFWLVLLAVIIMVAGSSVLVKKIPGKLDGFAQCLKSTGTIFYGAFWCPHCQATKALFGKSAKFLPYVECSTPNGQGQLQICADKKITGYPTWVFPDGSILTGERTLAELALASGCPLPQ